MTAFYADYSGYVQQKEQYSFHNFTARSLNYNSSTDVSILYYNKKL